MSIFSFSLKTSWRNIKVSYTYFMLVISVSLLAIWNFKWDCHTHRKTLDSVLAHSNGLVFYLFLLWLKKKRKEKKTSLGPVPLRHFVISDINYSLSCRKEVTEIIKPRIHHLWCEYLTGNSMVLTVPYGGHTLYSSASAACSFSLPDSW